MSKRIFLYLFIFLIIIFSIFCFHRFYQTDLIYDITFNLLSSAEKPVKKEVKLHLYNNEEKSTNKVLIRAYYFVPEDKGDFIINDWQKIFSQSLGNISAFYELQFAYNMEMNFEVYPEIIYSDQTADYFEDLIRQDYLTELIQPHSESLALKEIFNEVQEKANIEKEKDSYLINLFFLSLGSDYLEIDSGEEKIFGLNDEKNNSLIMADAFIDEEIKNFYESVAAHEIAHGLGIPDSYIYTNDKIESYGLMGAGFYRELENNYLDEEVKKKMGLPR